VGTPNAAEEASKISPIRIENEKPKPVVAPTPEAEPSAFAQGIYTAESVMTKNQKQIAEE